MATDYVLCIHGVNTRENTEPPTYADMLFDGIKNYIANQTRGKPPRDLKKVALYWGNVTIEEENELLEQYQNSDTWNNFWFKKLRSGALLQFAGDTALYISRYFGAKVAQKLKDDAEKGLGTITNRDPDSGDRLHIVAHSLGTVILFDLLFSARWKPPAPGHQYAMSLRDVVYGIEPNWHQGIYLASITTMGSPLGIFKLMSTNSSDDDHEANGHDITLHMQRTLKRIFGKLGGPIPWLNFVHPGDPIACPLKPLILSMVDPTGQYIAVQDILLRGTNVLDALSWLVRGTPLALIDAGHAHHGYLNNKQVCSTIAQAIIGATPK